MQKDTIIHGDALKVLEEIDEKSVDLVYLDPPFFTQDKHSLVSKNKVEYSFDDNNLIAFISKLRKKIELDESSPSYIQTIRGVGYRFSTEV